MEEKKVIKKRINESALVGLIKKMVLKEFRGDFDGFGHDGDRYYVRPNGRTNIMTRLDYNNKEQGKRALDNHHYKTINGKTEQLSDTSPSKLSNGKGSLCFDVVRFLEKTFMVDTMGKPTGKIEWTEEEQKAISKITTALHDLALLSKNEGNKKRGYNGPEEEPKDLNEAFGHTTEEEKLEAMRQWKEENLADDLDWEVYDRIDHYDTCLAGTVTSDEGWEFTAYGSGDEHGDFIGFDDNAPEIEFKMPDGREGYFYPNDSKVTMSESKLINHISKKVKKTLA